ncbi:MAG TPA: S49 family peptidase [Vicinamibacterales bacterium]|nr:S49 family peptidase [Vicinamibacterales bacterium]
MWLIPFALEHPWAVSPEFMPVVAEILARHAAGERLSEAEIEARIGDKRRAAEREPERSGAVAVVPLFGLVFPRANLMSAVSGATTAEGVGRQLRALAADDDVGSIVLDINSPGGQVAGITELAAVVREVRAQKPVIAVAHHLAASAAYWIASQATELVATPSAQVGAVGVYTMHEDLSKALEQQGIKRTIIAAGKHKVEASEIEPLSDEARAAIQARVDHVYGLFVKDIAKGRGVPVADVRNGFGEGRTVHAELAVRERMADRVATFDAVVAELVAGKWREPSRGASASDDSVPELRADAPTVGDPPLDDTDLRRRRARLAAATATHG